MACPKRELEGYNLSSRNVFKIKKKLKLKKYTYFYYILY